MTEEQTLPDRTPKTKRSRKPAAPRVRKPKDPGILAIEQAAAKQKEEYRKAQASQAILDRIIDKLVPRLTEEHRLLLWNAVGNTKLQNPAENPIFTAATGDGTEYTR